MKLNKIVVIALSVALIGLYLSIRFFHKAPDEFKHESLPYEKTRAQVIPDQRMLQLSISLAPLTICEALRQASIVLEAHYTAYTPISKAQKTFLETDYMPYVRNNTFQNFSPDELKSYASRDYKYLNDMLKKNGFSIQLQPFSPDSSIGVVAIQDIMVSWPDEGEKTTIKVANKSYEAVHLKKNVAFYTNTEKTYILVKLQTKTDDVVYFLTGLEQPLFKAKPDDQVIVQTVMKYHQIVHNELYDHDPKYTDVIFPMIDYEKQPSLEWLLNMSLSVQGHEYKIAQALQQIIFRMNEKGAVAKAAAAIAMMKSVAIQSEKKALVIDKPFLVWLERPHVPMPLFVDYMTQEYWKNPGDLSAKS